MPAALSPLAPAAPADTRAATAHGPAQSARAFALVCALLTLPAFALAAFAPIGYSVAIVFLFAGPHNWAEFRFFIARMPARWGRLTPYFTVAVGGVLLLGGANIALTLLAHSAYWSGEFHHLGATLWLASVALWAGALAFLRSREPGCARLRWALPVAGALTALACWRPVECFYALVYLHPLIAFVFLDRELKNWRPHWRRAYHVSLACIPLLLAALYWKLLHDGPLLITDEIALRITHHAGAGSLGDLPAHFLVAAHAFLETLHYGVWLLALPLLSLRGAPWSLRSVALCRRSLTLQRLLGAGFLLGALMVLVLWGAFWIDYGATRDVYFTLAVFHVLAEFPFLVRLA